MHRCFHGEGVAIFRSYKNKPSEGLASDSKMEIKMWFIVACLVSGVGLTSAQTCANETKITLINGYVLNLATTFNATLMNASLSTNEKTMIILNQVCDAPAVRQVVNNIETETAACPILASNITYLYTLEFGALSFTSLFQTFGSVETFCDCKMSLLSTFGIAAQSTNLSNTDTQLKYSLWRLDVLCDSDELKASVAAIASSLTTCAKVLDYSQGFLTVKNVQLMNTHVSQCATFNAGNFTCAVNASKQASFKTCIDGKTTDCGRNMCVKEYVGASCSAGRYSYMLAVNIVHSDTFALTEDKCNSATSVVMSLTLVLIGLLTALRLL